jgi:hypothetical protein
MRFILSLIMILTLVSPTAAQGSTPIHLVTEQTQQIFGNPDCWDEDDVHVRTWSGDLAPGESFTATEKFCDRNIDGMGPGGEGLFWQVITKSNVSAFIHQPSPQLQDGLNWPDPVYPYPDVPNLKTSNVRGSDRLVSCVMTFDNGEILIGSISPGIYLLTITNNGSRVAEVSLKAEVRMSDSSFQASCPDIYENRE